jgi:hypothetical protein
MIRRRLAASSSFVLAATRLRALQQDPTCAATLTRAATRKIPKNSQASPDGNTHGTGPHLHALLTTVAPMGAE